MERRVLFLFGFVVMLSLFTSCTIDTRPVYTTCLSSQYEIYSVGEVVSFTNCSDPADSYDWDFGDGFYSNDYQPNHVYNQAGNYTVVLTAYHGQEALTKSLQITIQDPVRLRIRAYYDGTSDVMSNADVILYGNQQDWNQDINRIASGVTDTYGEITFGGNQNLTLYNQVYYIYVSRNASSGYYSNQATQYYTPILNNGINDFEVDMRFFPAKKKENITKSIFLRKSPKAND